MDKIDPQETIQTVRLSAKSLPNGQWQSSKTPSCPICQDDLFIIGEDGIARPCECRSGAIKAAHQKRLGNYSRLTEDERKFRLKDIWVSGHGRDKAAYESVVRTAWGIVNNGGWLTLAGQYGIGKSFILCAIVNESVVKGKTALYITFTDLLECIKSTFNDNAKESSSQLWDNVLNADTLCLDEVDPARYRSSDWSESILFRMLNDRYRHLERGTVLATNNLDSLSEYLQSRVGDGRLNVFELRSDDVRPSLK